jgi:hypothetical protein
VPAGEVEESCPTMAAMLQNLSTGLSQQQLQDAADLAQGIQQQRKINDLSKSSVMVE